MDWYRKEDLVAAMDCLLLAAVDKTPLRTSTIDRLPPWRARLVVTVALRAGATLEHGDADRFDRAACAAGRQSAGQANWWSAALGLPPRDR
jgi:hypothetical protein